MRYRTFVVIIVCFADHACLYSATLCFSTLVWRNTQKTVDARPLNDAHGTACENSFLKF